MFKRIAGVFIFLCGVCVILTADAYAISWKNDLSSAKRAAAGSGKPIMVDFYTDWCGWCKKLDSETYADSRIQRLADEFICVKINGDKQEKIVNEYKVKGYPSIFFIDKNGGVIKNITGFVDANKLVHIMEVISKNSQTAKPPKSVKSGKNKAKEEKKEKFTLSGIVEGKEKRKAVINGAMVAVGDSVDGAKVEKISENSATLDYENRKIELYMGES